MNHTFRLLSLCGLVIAGIPGAVAAPPLLTVLHGSTSEVRDDELAITAGFVTCEPSTALLRSTFGPLGAVYGSGESGPTGRVFALKENSVGAPALSAVPSKGAEKFGYYEIDPPLELLRSSAHIDGVGEVAGKSDELSGHSVWYHVDGDVMSLIDAFDARFGGAISAGVHAIPAQGKVTFAVDRRRSVLACTAWSQ
ncbi:hypothetical protein [Pandoraea sp. ISTKB]|uniref:hypothetical protein n=1 Tax=Pandoraea sp. ISTKB TaxID=1586708 RepID=UPI000846F140|nr:hypothetical protein [Pandoraea sp. ISTKB]ODP35100.1 hypothetical protein A9762_12110 [Pandoraea sp. ISTKB]